MYHIIIIERLLKNELSATETYQQILDNCGILEKEFLTPIYKGHKDAASSLQKQISKLGETSTKISYAYFG
jgi:hypothetical protein